MISFRVDSRSVVPPYLQIVQQVRQALRMGLLDVGDKLPPVREVVAATAVNPNTVLKAYRDLEREGLTEARPGHGTFVLKRPPGPPPGTVSGSAAAWPGGSGKPARPGSTMSRSSRSCASPCCAPPPRGGDRMTPVIQTRGLSKRYRQRHRPERLLHHRPRRADIRADRAERRRQDHAAAPAGRAGQADRRGDGGARRRTPPGPGLPGRDRLPRPGDPAVPAVHRPGPHRHRRAPEPPLGRRIRTGPAEVAEHPAGPSGGLAVRRPASPAGPGADPGQEAQAAAAGRASRRTGPAGPAAFPGHLGRSGRRAAA